MRERRSGRCAGLDPGKGHSAILELARQIAVIAKLNNLREGLSVNPGVIEGGTRTNVIAAEASVEIDVRIKKAKQASGLDRKLRSLKPFDKRCKLEMTGGINRLPMERTAGVAALYRKAQVIAGELGWKLEEARRLAAARTEISPPVWAYQRSMVWAEWARARTRFTNTS